MKIITLILIFIPVIAYSNDLDSHRGIWESQNINSYSYTLRKGGVFGYSIYKVKVVNGVCKAKSKYVFKRKPIFWKKDICTGNTIEDLYGEVKGQIEEGVLKMEITYDKKYNYISYFTVDPKTDFTDQSWYFELTEFKAK